MSDVESLIYHFTEVVDHFNEIVEGFDDKLSSLTSRVSGLETTVGVCIFLQIVTIVILLWFVKKNNDKNNKL